MSVVSEHLDFYPPRERRTPRSYVLALVAHAFLLAALTWGVSWKRAPEPTVVEAELWSTVVQQAAPKLQEVAPPPPPPPPPPPKVEPAKPPKPTVKTPEVSKPTPEAPDPQIAIEKERKRLEKLEKELEKKQQEELKKAELEKKKQEEKERKELERIEKEKQRQLEAERKELERIEKEKQRQLELAEKQRQKEEAEAKERARQEAIKAAERAAERANALARMSGMANASGGPTAVGTAQQSTGPSSGYGALVNQAVRPNIVYSAEGGDPVAEVQVITSADGTVISSRLVKSSGFPAWDAAVLRAIDKTGKMPKDRDGQVPVAITSPPGLVIRFTR